MNAAVFHKEDSADLFKILHTVPLKPGNEFLQCQLALVNTNDVHTAGKIQITPLRSVGAAGNNELDTVGFGNLDEADDVIASNDVRVKTQNPGPQPFHD